MLYITPMNPDTDVTYQTVNLYSSDKCFIYLISDVPHYILGKVDISPHVGEIICSYFGITFLLIFMKTENAVYKPYQNSTLLFINGLIFDIMNIQNKQFPEFEWKPMLAPLRSVNDRRFSWLRNVFLKSSQDFKKKPRKLYKRCWPENVHIMANTWTIDW